MKELVKPQDPAIQNDGAYHALSEMPCNTILIECLCDVKFAYADDDMEQVIF